jgi:hypothetical protein
MKCPYYAKVLKYINSENNYLCSITRKVQFCYGILDFDIKEQGYKCKYLNKVIGDEKEIRTLFKIHKRIGLMCLENLLK